MITNSTTTCIIEHQTNNTFLKSGIEQEFPQQMNYKNNEVVRQT